jgi:hypothetical protein
MTFRASLATGCFARSKQAHCLCAWQQAISAMHHLGVFDISPKCARIGLHRVARRRYRARWLDKPKQ